MQISKQEYAKRLASRGFEILRVQPDDKLPMGKWADEATTDLEVIDRWFKDNPKMNYGVRGGQNGVIIDIDNKPDADGMDTILQIEMENGFFHEDSFRVKSPSGGMHIYFRTYGPYSNSHNFGKGVDVRGVTGYVVGPGCTFRGKSYIPDDCDISDMEYVPAWLAGKYLKEPGVAEEHRDDSPIELDLPENIELARQVLETAKPAIEGQHGDDTTLQVACQIRDRAISPELCLDLMYESDWNKSCEPPWDYDELSIKVENAYKYAKNRIGSQADLMEKFVQHERSANSDFYKELQKVEDKNKINVGIEDGKTADDYLYNVREFKARGKRREYIIPEWLIAHGFTAINAKRSMGKSTVMLDLACRMAAGLDWQGLPIKEGYTPVYLCGEDDEGLELNLNAWEKEWGEIPEENMILADQITNLMSVPEVEKWAEAIGKKLNGRKAVLFMDTWQRASSFGGQNKDEDMQKCVYNLESLANCFDGPAIVAFHPPKHTEHTIHGSAVLENATTAIWQLEECTEGRKLAVSRIKGPGEGNFRKFQFKQIDLEIVDSFGNPLKGLIPMLHSGSGTPAPNTMDSERAAWATAICGFEQYQNAKEDKSDNVELYLSKVAERMHEYAQSKVYTEYLKGLYELGIDPNLKTTATNNKWKEIFPRHLDRQEIVTKDGYVVFIIGEGKKRKFKISKDHDV